MTDENRNKAYLSILTWGLIEIRNASSQGDVVRCRIESEHLHNIPSLIGEKNLERHLYYFNKERVMYIDACKNHDEQVNGEAGACSIKHYLSSWEDLLKYLDNQIDE